jgi:hypothetical protein
MPEPSQQQPNPKNSVGYRPLIPVEFTKNLGNSATAYIAAAAGLGLALGVTIALTAGHAKPGAAPRVAEALVARTQQLTAIPTVYAATTPSLVTQAGKPKKHGAHLVLAADDLSSKKSAATKKHSRHRLWYWRRDKKNGVARKPYIPSNPPAPADPPTGLELATAAAAAGPFYLGIEGDATVASYNDTTGKIETYEGSTFMLASATTGGSTIAWDDFPFNVHYRCDESGQCTMIHRGASATARMVR